MACVYILFSEKTKCFYKGSTREDTPEDCFKAHNAGRVRSTKNGVPWKLIHVDIYPDYTTARKNEIFLKSGAGRKWIQEKFSDLIRRGG